MGTKWRMPLAVMGRPTGDRRGFDPHALEHLDTPLPWRYAAQDVGGHATARVVGRIDKIEYAKEDGRPWGSGEFFDGEDAPEDIRKAAAESLYLAEKGVVGPSVDLDSSESEGRKEKRTLGEQYDCGCPDKAHEQREYQAVTHGRIRAATLVHIPAFAELSGEGTFTRVPAGGGDPNVAANAADTETFDVQAFVTLHEAAQEAGLLAAAEQDADEAVAAAFAKRRRLRDIDSQYGDDVWAVDPNVGGGVDRSEIPDSDFVDPRGRRFPIVTPKDVRDAVSSYGRAKPLIPLGRFRARLTAIAQRKGEAFVAALPDSWDTLTASVGTLAHEAPPAEWFDDPKLDGPTPLTITDDGRVFGHLATWGTCHTGINDACVMAPRSRTGYALFHTGELVAAGGRRIPVGRLTYGGGHARHHLGYAAAAEHYDATSAVGAYVRAGEDAHGIWVAGAMEPTAGDAAYRTMRAAPLSGDWRRVGGNLELVAALHVNTPGFPVPRAVTAGGELVSLTSAGAIQPASQPAGVEALDLPGLVREAVREVRRQDQRRAAALAASARMRELAEEGNRERYAEAQMTMAALAAGLDSWEG